MQTIAEVFSWLKNGGNFWSCPTWNLVVSPSVPGKNGNLVTFPKSYSIHGTGMFTVNFTYMKTIRINQMWVNIPYIECLGI